MEILFVSRSGKNGIVPPIIKSQGESLNHAGVNVDFFLIVAGGISGYLRSMKMLKEKVKHKNYAVIHVHYGVSGIMVILSRLKIPLVISLMGSDILASVNKNLKIGLKDKVLSSLVRQSLSYFDAIIVKSKEMALQIRQKVFVIPNGVSFDNFYPISKKEARRNLGIEEDKVVLLFPANMKRKEKNFPLFNEAVEQLKLDNLEVLTFQDVPHEQTKYYFNAADVVVLTSLHEGSPNVIKEAMACNRPIVATDVGDVYEVIGHTKGSFICKFDSSDISDKIKRLIELKEDTDGRDEITHLESKVIANKIVDIYKSII